MQIVKRRAISISMSGSDAIAAQSGPGGKIGWFAALRSPYILAPSVIFLIGANLVPLIGVVWWGWDLFSLMALYWIETGIVGFFTLLHLMLVAGWGALFLVPFFIFHFGTFMSVHMMFLWTMFGSAWATQAGGALAAVHTIVIEKGLWIAIAGLFFSHGVSFYLNVLRKGQAKRGAIRPQDVMMRPYGRVIVMHLTIIFGAVLATVFQTSLAAFVLLIALKTAADVASHVRKNFAPATVNAN